MKLSKSLLSAIAVGVALGGLTSCNSSSADVSDPELTERDKLLNQSESTYEPYSISPEDLLRKVCIPYRELEGCPACGMG